MAAGNIKEMERAATGSDGVRHDWRAADRLNGIVSPERYGQQQQPQADARPALPQTVNVWIEAAYGLLGASPAPRAGQVVEARQIEDRPQAVGQAPQAIEYNI